MSLSVYREAYGRGGPRLLLVHGWGLHGGVWLPLIDELSQRYQVTVVDLPGHGRSGPLPPDAALEALAQAVAEAVATPAIWVGWSLGGLVALAAARRWPEAVIKLVLIGATPRFAQGPGWDCAIPAATLDQFGRDLAADYQRTLIRFLSLQLGAGEGARASLRELRQHVFQVPPPDAAGLQAGLRLLRETDLRALLQSITRPAQLVHGAKDRLVPPAAAHYLAAHLPDARLALIPDAGHAPFLSHRRQFLETLTHFCETES